MEYRKLEEITITITDPINIKMETMEGTISHSIISFTKIEFRLYLCTPHATVSYSIMQATEDAFYCVDKLS